MSSAGVHLVDIKHGWLLEVFALHSSVYNWESGSVCLSCSATHAGIVSANEMEVEIRIDL